MIVTQTRYRLTTATVLFAGMAVLAGCGATPTSTTTTNERTTITTPPPMMATTTTTTEQTEAIDQPAHVTHAHHRTAGYATNHHRDESGSTETDTTTDTTVTPVSPTSTTVKSTDTTTTVH